MKKTIITTGLIIGSLFGSAQKMNTTGAVMAYQDFQENLHSGNFEKATKDILEAKKLIDLAIVHESTKNDPKTIYYSFSVYREIIKLPQSEELNFTTDTLISVIMDDMDKLYLYDVKGKYVPTMESEVGTDCMMMSNTGKQMYNEKDYASAFIFFADAFETALLIKQVDSASASNAAYTAELAGNIEGAIHFYGVCIDINYQTEKSYRKLGDILVKNNRKDEAYAMFAKAVEEHPESLNLIFDEINLYLTDKKYTEANEKIANAIKLDPENMQLYLQAGTIYSSSKQYPEAINMLEKATELNPESALAWASLGDIYFNKGADLWNQALETNSDAKYDKLTKEAKAEFAKAVVNYEKSFALDNTDRATAQSLMQLYGKLGNSTKFKEMKAILAN